MRRTPAQIAIRLICGRQIPPFARGPSTLSQSVRDGHELLVGMTKRDFGYDLQAWHDYLKESRDGGYTYGRNIVLPKIMQAALASAEWQAAVRAMEPGCTGGSERISN
jgi:hypothetical protein